MFDEEEKPKITEFPRNLDNMSVSELEEYVQALRGEIERVESDKAKKQASQDAAAAVFKS